MIPSDFIDDLLAKTDIVDIIDERVPLKKSGANYMACCPFHKEKTPSFSVSPSKQFYHCFSCGAHGSAIGFLMEQQGMSFPDAVQYLADRAGMTVPHEKTANAGRNPASLRRFLPPPAPNQPARTPIPRRTRPECRNHRPLRIGLCTRRLAAAGASLPALSQQRPDGMRAGHP